MGTIVQQLLGFFLALLGLIGTLTSMVIPHWSQTAYYSTNFVTASQYIKGLWIECVSHTTGFYQCEVHRSMLSLPKDLLVSRVLMLLSCTISIVAAIISSIGMKCTRCIHQSHAKGPLALSGGACFIVAGLFCLITASWITSNIIRDAYDLFSTSGMKYEVGLAVYISFASAIFSIFGGCMLCLASWYSRNHVSAKIADTNDPKHLILAYQPNVFP